MQNVNITPPLPLQIMSFILPTAPLMGQKELPSQLNLTWFNTSSDVIVIVFASNDIIDLIKKCWLLFEVVVTYNTKQYLTPNNI